MLKERFITYIVFKYYLQLFSDHQESISRELVVDIEKVDAIII